MKNNLKIKYTIVALLCQLTALFAQTPVFDDNVQDVPIDGWVVPMVLVGVILILYYLNKKHYAAK